MWDVGLSGDCQHNGTPIAQVDDDVGAFKLGNTYEDQHTLIVYVFFGQFCDLTN